MKFSKLAYAKEYNISLGEGTIDIVFMDDEYYVLFCPYDDEYPMEELDIFDNEQKAIDFKNSIE